MHAFAISTPRGHDHFYDLYESAQDQQHWQTFQFTTEEGENVRPEEIACATKELDERTYRQEFQATFENISAGRVYYAFDRKTNGAANNYNPRNPLFWSLDFNVNPMCSVIAPKCARPRRLHQVQRYAPAISNTSGSNGETPLNKLMLRQ